MEEIAEVGPAEISAAAGTEIIIGVAVAAAVLLISAAERIASGVRAGAAAGSAAAARVILVAFLAYLVINGAFLFVRQYGVSLVYIFKFFGHGRFFAFRMQVRMVLARGRFERLFDFGVRGVFAYAQNFVIIFILCHTFPLLSPHFI